ncbi:MAG: alpha-ketoacid dehydrogenase subunit beta [Proteobacteria bacterium]|nr:alpha-ketoacid dehydrogenase subunit beta [Pseudomonadota bacterium]
MLDKSKRQISFVEAIREALDQSMENDPNVIIIGEGVPDPKAIFNSTAGLFDKYGNKRVFDMPLSENGLTGVCIGAAMSGLRPVMVHQRIDFALLAMDQLINNAAKWTYIFDGKVRVPLVVRMLIGRGWGQGPQHSQSLQAMFAHVPGLKVVMPVTAQDAKGMLIAAIEDDNPVMFIEHRWLHHITDIVSEDYYTVPLDKAKVMFEGTDVTIAAFSYMVLESLIAARALESIGISVEVIDMRSARPLDIATVLNSVKKTGRLIVADTAYQTGNIAGEVISQVVENAMEILKSNPVRISSPDYPTPTSHHMAAEYYPSPKVIVDAVLNLVEISRSEIKYDDLCASFQNKNPHDVPNRDFSGPF